MAEWVVTWKNRPGFLKRQFPGIVKKSLKSMMKFWFFELFPTHFELGAAQEYGYQKRKRVTMVAKARLKHHAKPMTFTGHMARTIKSNFTEPTGSAKSVKMKLRGPLKMRFRGVKGTGPDMISEMKAVSDKDRKLLARHLSRDIERRMSRLKGKSKKRIRA